MQKLPITSVLLVVVFSLSPIFVSGCNECVAQSPEQESATQSKEKVEIAKLSDGKKKLLDLPKISTRLLIEKADKALRGGDIVIAHLAIAEVHSRNKVDLGSKMEIARILFGTGQMKAAAQVYDEVLESRPEIKPQLWQRGLALYYAEEFEKGVDQFDTHQTYNSQDVENSVWQLLCQARLTSVEEARKSMIQIEKDSRVPMKQVFDMFAGTGSPDEVITASGYDAEKVIRNGSTYHGWIYVGLFHEMMGDKEASIEAMKTALKCKPIIPSLMGNVAEGHLRARDAYPSGKDEE